MTTIKMLVAMAGTDISYIPGRLYTVSDRIAQAWAEAGLAVIVQDVEQVEQAAETPAPERAARVRRTR